MSLRDKLLGQPLSSEESDKQELTVFTGVPVMGLDALASTGYGPEAALTALLPLGIYGLRYFPYIILAIVMLLVLLYFSYRQTAEAYPNGGGAYIVVRDNFGYRWGALAAVCLMLDYLLNVAVAIAAGVGALVSAIPPLHPHILSICLLVLLTLTVLNLRGVRQSGLIFVAPVALFIICMATTLAFGIVQALYSGGAPSSAVPLPPIPRPIEAASIWVLLSGFANGCTAMTGIEAVSNGVPLFREPKIRRAHATLTVIILILGLFLLALGYLCPSYHISAMPQQKPGYQTILSQLVEAVFGRGGFYYVAITSIFIVLIYSAQTSFADFPRVCRFLAEDGFLPAGFANRGRRLVYVHGIILLAAISAILLIAFGGITDRLIPLFAIGAFGAFLSSQLGMVSHWKAKHGRNYRKKLFFNALGALGTSMALVVLIAAKFVEGAWITLVVLPLMYLMIYRIRKRTEKIKRAVGKAIELRIEKTPDPIVVIPIGGWNHISEKAVRFAYELSKEIIAVHISTERDNPEELRAIWATQVEKPARGAGVPAPRLEIISSPYRLVYAPLLNFIERVKSENPGRRIAVVIPELIDGHWYHFLLDNQYGNGLRVLLYLKGDERTVVISTPWYLKKREAR